MREIGHFSKTKNYMHLLSFYNQGTKFTKNLLRFTLFSHIVILFSSIMGLPSVGMGQNAGPMKVIKAARVLRPLKLVSGVPSKY